MQGFVHGRQSNARSSSFERQIPDTKRVGQNLKDLGFNGADLSGYSSIASLPDHGRRTAIGSGQTRGNVARGHFDSSPDDGSFSRSPASSHPAAQTRSEEDLTHLVVENDYSENEQGYRTHLRQSDREDPGNETEEGASVAERVVRKSPSIIRDPQRLNSPNEFDVKGNPVDVFGTEPGSDIFDTEHDDDAYVDGNHLAKYTNSHPASPTEFGEGSSSVKKKTHTTPYRKGFYDGQSNIKLMDTANESERARSSDFNGRIPYTNHLPMPGLTTQHTALSPTTRSPGRLLGQLMSTPNSRRFTHDVERSSRLNDAAPSPGRNYIQNTDAEGDQGHPAYLSNMALHYHDGLQEDVGAGQAGRHEYSERESQSPANTLTPPTRKSKRLHSQTQGNGEDVRQDAATRKGERVLDLDYDKDQLFNMKYEDLEEESFDHLPRSSVSVLPRDKVNAPIEEQVTIAMELPSTERRSFFASLSMQDWLVAGQQLVSSFEEITKDLERLRREKRELGAVFEAEVSRRHKTLIEKDAEFDSELQRMKESGSLVIQGAKSPNQKPGVPGRTAASNDISAET